MKWSKGVLCLFLSLILLLLSGVGVIRMEAADNTTAGHDEAYEELLAIYLALPKTDTEELSKVPSYEQYMKNQSGILYSGLDFTVKNDLSEPALISEMGGEANYAVSIPEDALYAISFAYQPEGDFLLPNILSVTVDGETPYTELGALEANNVWVSGDFPLDRYGNQCVVMPSRDNIWQTSYLRPVTGFISSPMQIYLTKGEHRLQFVCQDGAVYMGDLTLGGLPVYDMQTGGSAAGTGIVFIEAEQIDRRNNPSIRTAAEYNTSVSPYSATIRVQNHIDGNSFRYAGGRVEYDFTVSESGYYNLSLNFRQNEKTEFHTYRNIYVDGQIPSDAFWNVGFGYSRFFDEKTIPETVYLEAGEHTLELETSLEAVGIAVKILEEIVGQMSDLALRISWISGGNTEKYRDFRLGDYGIDAAVMLNDWAALLEDTYSALYKLKSGSGSKCGQIEPLMVTAKLLRNLAKEPNELPKRLNEFSYSAGSARQYLTTAIESLSFSQLALDSVTLWQNEAKRPKSMGFLSSVFSNIERFFYSFTIQEYTPEYDGQASEALEIWVNRSRQYLEIMQTMADTGFTAKNGIKVNLSIIPDSNKLILANASGKAPDAALSISSGQVYDLAIRGALEDMRGFDTFKEVGNRFAPGMLIPGVYDEGVYAIPETFNFWVLYYRTDILDNLGLDVPDTWNDVLAMLPQLRRMGMNFNSHVSNFVAKPFAATAPFIFQNNGLIFDLDTGMAAFDSQEATNALQTLTENYTIYNMQVEIRSFYQNFRDGRTPVGVSDYGTFNLLTNAAPELAGHWGVALYPGLVDDEGNVQRWTSGSAESNVIFSSSGQSEAAWEFMDWWMSDEVQTEFAFTLQATLGNEYLWNSANLNAMANAPWNRKHKDVILEQLTWTYETPKVPGSYMAERELSNAINSVISDGMKYQSAMDEAKKRTDREIRRKLEEFGYTENGEYIKPVKLPTVETIKEWLK